MTEIKRYNPSYMFAGRMLERADGEWVRWADVEALLAVGPRDMPEDVGTRRWLAGEKPNVSTGICDSLTFGYGRLDPNGYWEFPVHPRIAELLAERDELTEIRDEQGKSIYRLHAQLRKTEAERDALQQQLDAIGAEGARDESPKAVAVLRAIEKYCQMDGTGMHYGFAYNSQLGQQLRRVLAGTRDEAPCGCPGVSSRDPWPNHEPKDCPRDEAPEHEPGSNPRRHMPLRSPTTAEGTREEAPICQCGHPGIAHGHSGQWCVDPDCHCSRYRPKAGARAEARPSEPIDLSTVAICLDCDHGVCGGVPCETCSGRGLLPLDHPRAAPVSKEARSSEPKL